MAPHHRVQMGMLVADEPMPVSLAPVGDRSQCAGVAVLCRYLPHRVPACPGLAPYVAKAKKGERGPIRFRMRAICSLEAKIDEARLVGMKCEPIPRKPLAQNTQYPLGVAEVCERHHGIVG